MKMSGMTKEEQLQAVWDNVSDVVYYTDCHTNHCARGQDHVRVATLEVYESHIAQAIRNLRLLIEDFTVFHLDALVRQHLDREKQNHGMLGHLKMSDLLTASDLKSPPSRDDLFQPVVSQVNLDLNSPGMSQQAAPPSVQKPLPKGISLLNLGPAQVQIGSGLTSGALVRSMSPSASLSQTLNYPSKLSGALRSAVIEPFQSGTLQGIEALLPKSSNGDLLDRIKGYCLDDECSFPVAVSDDLYESSLAEDIETEQAACTPASMKGEISVSAEMARSSKSVTSHQDKTNTSQVFEKEETKDSNFSFKGLGFNFSNKLNRRVKTTGQSNSEQANQSSVASKTTLGAKMLYSIGFLFGAGAIFNGVFSDGYDNHNPNESVNQPSSVCSNFVDKLSSEILCEPEGSVGEWSKVDPDGPAVFNGLIPSAKQRGCFLIEPRAKEEKDLDDSTTKPADPSIYGLSASQESLTDSISTHSNFTRAHSLGDEYGWGDSPQAPWQIVDKLGNRWTLVQTKAFYSEQSLLEFNHNLAVKVRGQMQQDLEGTGQPAGLLASTNQASDQEQFGLKADSLNWLAPTYHTTAPYLYRFPQNGGRDTGPSGIYAERPAQWVCYGEQNLEAAGSDANSVESASGKSIYDEGQLLEMEPEDVNVSWGPSSP